LSHAATAVVVCSTTSSPFPARPLSESIPAFATASARARLWRRSACRKLGSASLDAQDRRGEPRVKARHAVIAAGHCLAIEQARQRARAACAIKARRRSAGWLKVKNRPAPR
jgi:hypothetical protein